MGGAFGPRATFCHGKLPWKLFNHLLPLEADASQTPRANASGGSGVAWMRKRECTSGNQWHAHDRDCQSFYRLAQAGQVSAPARLINGSSGRRLPVQPGSIGLYEEHALTICARYRLMQRARIAGLDSRSSAAVQRFVSVNTRT